MAAILVAGGTSHAQTPEPLWPTQGWRHATPEEQGFDSDGLAEAVTQARLSGMRIHSLMVVRNGSVILDAYFWPFEQGQRHDIASVTKTVTTTLVGVGIGQSAFTGVSQPVSSIFPERSIANLDHTKRRMTLEDLLTMRSGLDCQAGQGEITLSQMRGSDDWTQFMLDLPMREAPGSRFEYCSGGMHLLSSAITEATGLSALDLARRDLFGPMGITDVAWPADVQGVSHGWGDLQLRPVDMAKLGYLWLHRGRWEDRQLVPEAWMDAAVQPHRDRGYGYGFWILKDRQPVEYEANGRGGQRITVIPERDLVIVMTGGEFEPGDVGAFLGRALKSDGPLPPNPAGVARLNAAVAQAAHPTPPAGYLSPMASTVSGRRYRLEPNPLNLRGLTVDFSQTEQPQLELQIGDHHDGPRPIGMDGVPRLSPAGYSGLPVALSGAWRGEDTFVFEYNEVGGINAYEFRLRFSGDDVSVTLSERSRVISTTTFRGKAEG